MFVDPSGEIFMLVTGAAGAVVGGIGGVIYSGVKYGEVRWQNVAAGAAIGGAVGLTRGVAAAYITAGSDFASTGAVIVGTKVMVAGIGTVGYQTFQQFKDAYGRAGDGRAWHHIVEQSATNINKFGAEMIKNARNIVNIQHGTRTLHNAISAYYSSKIPEISGNMTIRAWLQTKSYNFQYNFGLETLARIAKEVGAKIQFVK